MTIPTTERFTNRVADYVRHRPGYPPEVLRLLRSECGLAPAHVVADIGFGTGLLTELFLKNGNAVVGVEPNAAMRAAGENHLRAYANFTSINATAEATTLPNESVDFVVAGQAFHWFDHKLVRHEFRRVLKSEGWTALVWNEPRKDSTPFLAAYERLLQTYGTDYAAVRANRVYKNSITEFFAPASFKEAVLEQRQVFDFDGLKGRLLSSSYAPEPGHPRHEPMMEELRRIFTEHAGGGQVTFEYDTLVFYGQLRAAI